MAPEGDRQTRMPQLGAEFRMTKQRQEVYDILVGRSDHPTATDVFVEAKERIPSISLATVYNTLETLAGCGLVRQVSMDKAPARFCGNLENHGHFHCSNCDSVFDVSPMNEGLPGERWKLPKGAEVVEEDVCLKGVCPDCASQTQKES